MNDDTTFVIRFAGRGAGRAVAIKDLIDVTGSPTIAGCRALAEAAEAATADAACLTGIRRAESEGELHLVGKTNLHELAFGITGINHWTGTPANPLDPDLVPGGSSSGSAVAVANGQAALALGTDTGGSIRIPAACCGVAGLKTTIGRIPMTGIRTLAPSLDTVGPLAAGVPELVWGMQLLEPGFTLAGSAVPGRIGRFRIPARPEIDEAIDLSLARAGFELFPVEVPGWDRASADTMKLIAAEAFDCNGYLLPTGRVGADVAGRLRDGERTTANERRRLQAAVRNWRGTMVQVLATAGLLALPVLSDFPPRLDNPEVMYSIRQTHPVNLAGLPALALPVPTDGAIPASLQLVGPPGSEEVLLSAGLLLQGHR